MPLIIPSSFPGVGRSLSELQTAVRNKGGFYTDTDDVQAEAINECYRELVQYRDWWWLRRQASGTLTAGSTVLAEPSDVKDQAIQQIRVRDTSGTETPLAEVGPEAFRTLAQELTTRGLPTYWAWMLATTGAQTAHDIQVLRVPDQAYTVVVDYLVEVTPLVQPTDKPLVPQDHQDILVWGAITDLAARQRDWNLYDRAEVKYERLRMQMVNDDARFRNAPVERGRMGVSGTHEALEVSEAWLT